MTLLPFNLFTIHDLVAFMSTASLALFFYILYFRLGRQVLDLLLANICLCNAIICFSAFVTDNLVPAGTSAWGIAGWMDDATLSRLNLQWNRLGWLTGFVLAPSLVHFVLRYSQRRTSGRVIGIVYVASLAAMPVAFSDSFLRARPEPLAPTSSWACSVPWQPEMGILADAFTLCWAVTQVFIVVLAWRAWRGRRYRRSPFGHQRLVLVALAVFSLCGLTDMTIAALGYLGPALIPVASMVMTGLLGTAVLMDREQARRSAYDLDREAREEERRKVAKDLHDSLAQDLVGLNLALQAGSDETDVRTTQGLFEAAATQCKSILQNIRFICYGLFPPTLESAGLASAIRRLLEYPRLNRFHADVQCDDSLCEARFRPEIEIALFRIAQEAISNALRHSQGSELEVRLHRHGSQLLLTIQDNGKGFEDRREQAGLGIPSMQSRAAEIGGRFAIESQPGQTVVQVAVPMDKVGMKA